tara:strand:- start:969 stop:1298 length:330 start_codon:yes stop_codon:yes gene_type:complete
MKRKYLFIALAMGTLSFSQARPELTNVKCSKKCTKYYKEDTKGNTIHDRSCIAEVYMSDLDPCLFDKYGLAHPIHIKLHKLKEEVAQLRQIVDTQRDWIEELRKITVKN